MMVHPTSDATHIVDEPGARYSRCGVKDPKPVCWAVHVDRHIAGHEMVVCPDCAALPPAAPSGRTPTYEPRP